MKRQTSTFSLIKKFMSLFVTSPIVLDFTQKEQFESKKFTQYEK